MREHICKGNTLKRKIIKTLLSVMPLVMVLYILSSLPIEAEISKNIVDEKTSNSFTISDNPTLNDYLELFPASANSTKNTGRIWSDKTVLSENYELDDGKGIIPIAIDPSADEDFNIVFSTISSSKKITGKLEVALDVSFILDISGSMAYNKKLDDALNALNSSVNTLMGMNSYNRISLTTFDDGAKVVLPLDRYTKINDKGYFGLVIPSTEDFYYRGVYVKNSSGKTIEDYISAHGATNTQLGYAVGMEVLEKENVTTAEIDGRISNRIPVVVMLTDGQPTYSINDKSWWSSTSDKYQGSGIVSYAGNGMLAMMTAAYRKESINRNYQSQDVSLYTIGFGTENLENADDNALAAITLNPTTYWDSEEHEFYKEIRTKCDDYVNKRTTIIKVNDSNSESVIKDYELTHPNTDDINEEMLKKYVDRYYHVNNANELNEAFKKIIEEISLNVPDYPTKIEPQKNPLNSGYVTYTDPIGEYMEVKKVKSIIYDGKAYPVVNNSDGTYSASGEILHPVYGYTNLTNVKINTITDSSGNQTLVVKVPAATIPLVIDVIELDNNDKVTTHTQTKTTPIRVVYSVGLKKEINRDNLQEVSDQYIINNSDNGLVNFYSNRYSKNNLYGNTTVSFEPSTKNPNYHVQNTQVLLDSSDKTLRHISDIDEEETYHYYIEYYVDNIIDKEKNIIPGRNLKHPQAAYYLEEKDDQVSIKPGAARIIHLESFIHKKSENSTGTATNYYHPIYQNESKTLTFHQGNNGLLKLDKPVSLIVSKDVVVKPGFNPTNRLFNFKLTIPSKQGLTINAKLNDQNKLLTFNEMGVTTFTLDENQTIVIPNMTNTAYTIEEINIPIGYTSNYDANTTKDTVRLVDKSVQFINTYELSSVTLNGAEHLSFSKKIEGRDWLDGESFTFKIEAITEDAPMPEESKQTITISKATLGHKASFGDITYTSIDMADATNIDGVMTKIFKYKVYEEIPKGTDNGVKNGLKYDNSERTITVTLTNDDNGGLTATPSYEGLQTFTNTYFLTPKEDSITGEGDGHLTITKNLTGRDMVNQEFQFELVDADAETEKVVANGHNDAEGVVTFETVTFTKPDAYNYIVREVVPSTKNGVTYDETKFTVQAEVEDNLDGTMNVTWTSDEPISFENSYVANPTAVTLYASKSLIGRDLVAGEFEFILKDLNGEVIQRKTNNANGAVVFDEIAFESSDDCVFFIEEVKGNLDYVQYDQTIYEVLVAVKDNGQGQLVPEIKYKTLVNDEEIEVEAAVFANKYNKPKSKPTIIIIPNTATKAK